jgi:hypothetical protein
MRRVRSVTVAILLLSLATVAAAFTVVELQQRADTLLSTYQTIYSQASACTNGQCSERSAIESGFAAAESNRSQIHADRNTLDPCSTCQELDATLQSIDDTASDVAGIIEGWAGQG